MLLSNGLLGLICNVQHCIVKERCAEIFVSVFASVFVPVFVYALVFQPRQSVVLKRIAGFNLHGVTLK